MASATVTVVVEGALFRINVKSELVTDGPVSDPPAVTVKFFVPPGVRPAVVVIVSVVVLLVPEPLNVSGEKEALVPAGVPPIQLIDQLPEQFPLLFVRVIDE